MPAKQTASESAGPKEFASFYEANADQLLVWFTRRVLDAEVALDLTSETFAQAYVSATKFKGSGEREAAGWLYGIARHQLSRYLRRGRAETKTLRRLGLEIPAYSDGDIAEVERMAELDELRRQVGPRLERLSKEQRQAIELRVIDELPYPQVADRLGISEVSARARVSRALRILAKSFEPPVDATKEAK